MNLDAWTRELEGDKDASFILTGLKTGFHIRDPSANPTPCDMANYRSATGQENFSEVDKQILAEIAEGNYVVCEDKPTMVSALGAIRKEGGGVRLIHDCSRPDGSAVNDLATKEKFQYQSIDDVLGLVTPGCYLAKVDLKNAYRSIPISQESQQVTGLSWFINGKKTYLKDVKLPFGANLSPFIFNTITQSVRRMMANRGYTKVVCYLDDFCLIADSKTECQHMVTVLVRLLRELGFKISWPKLEGPSTNITFLGIHIDSITMTCSIPDEKIQQIASDLAQFKQKYRASKKQLQSLVGKLNWVARVMPIGRIYLRAAIQGITSLKAPSHKIIINAAIRSDLDWWLDTIPILNGTQPIRDPRPVETMATDACVTGAGGVFENDWFYLNWQADCPEMAGLHINFKETLAVVLAARRWAPRWANKQIIVYTDSMAAKGMLTNMKANDGKVSLALKELATLAILYNFSITPRHVPGEGNTLPDCISRIDTRSMALKLLWLWPLYSNNVICMDPGVLLQHMSYQSFCFLYQQGSPLVHGRTS